MDKKAVFLYSILDTTQQQREGVFSVAAPPVREKETEPPTDEELVDAFARVVAEDARFHRAQTGVAAFARQRILERMAKGRSST